MIIGGAIAPIPGLPERAQQNLMGLFDSSPRFQEVWLYGSRAMGRERPGSDVDLCLTGETLGHGDLLQMMVTVDDLLLPWKVDLVLRHQLPDDLLGHINRVGRCIWRQV